MSVKPTRKSKERVYAVLVEQPLYRTHWVWATNKADAKLKIAGMIRNEKTDLIASEGDGEGDEKILEAKRDDGYLGPVNSVRSRGRGEVRND